MVPPGILVNTCRKPWLKRRSRITVTSIPVEQVATEDAYAGANDRELIGSALARLNPDH